MNRLLSCVAVICMLAAFVSYCRSQDRDPPKTAAAMLQLQWSRRQGEGAGPVKLTTFPLRLEDIGHIRPLGLMASGHVTPSDHLYLIPRQPKSKDERFDVLAVADGRVVVLQWRPQGSPDPTVFERKVDIKVVVEHSATCWSYVDHLVELDAGLRNHVERELKPGQPVHMRIPVKAGQVIGKIGYQTMDFALVDANVTRKGFLVPEQFLKRDPWKVHTVDPFDYIEEPLRGKLLAFNPRKVPPLGGRIDYDLDGRLIGNWYREKAGGYAGLNKRLDYWVGHLTIAYHYIDPSQIIVSLGDFEGRPRQFQVRGNGPDPAKITKDVGPVKYELIMPKINDGTGKPYADAPDRPMGVMLVEVLAERRLRVEVFPRKKTDDVKGFTQAAAIYER